MVNCPKCGFKRWILTSPLQKTTDGLRLYQCGRGNCNHLEPEDVHWIRKQPKILYIDVEVSKARVDVFDLRVRGEYISYKDIDKERYIICWSAGWVGSKKIYSACVSPEDALDWTDKNIMQPLYDLMEQADVISGHNVDRFDLPMVNTRFVENGMGIITGYKTQDTLKMVKHKFRFMSNALDYIAPKFGFRPKDAMCNEDWLKISRSGDQSALKKMLKYNRGDVRNGMGVLTAITGISDKPIEYYMRTLPSEPKRRR